MRLCVFNRSDFYRMFSRIPERGYDVCVHYNSDQAGAEATAEAVRTSGASQALVVGTAVTMGSGLFEAPLRALGVDPGARLTSDEIASFTALLDTYFYIGRGAEGRAALEGWLAPWLKKRPGAVVVLACTDLAIGFPEAEGRAIFEAGGVTYVDAMAAHVDAILSKLGARKS